MCLVITCETAGEAMPSGLCDEGVLERVTGGGKENDMSPMNRLVNAVPLRWQRKLASTADRPARYVAQFIAARLDAKLIIHEFSNDLIDVSRPLGHRQLFSKHTRRWPKETRERLVDAVYHPYRRQVRSAIEERLSVFGCAIHLSLRSFDLRSRGKIRRTDVGLLYDPARGDELDFCLDWMDAMWEFAPMLRVRRNYPRRGKGEGLIQSLRTEFGDRDYLGVEVWLNRAWAGREVSLRDEAMNGLCQSLGEILMEDGGEARVRAA